MLDETDNDLVRASVVRAFRQRLESLGRAGLDQIPAGGARRSRCRSPCRSRRAVNAIGDPRAVAEARSSTVAESEAPARDAARDQLLQIRTVSFTRGKASEKSRGHIDGAIIRRIWVRHARGAAR